jgi:hypothetical protein
MKAKLNRIAKDVAQPGRVEGFLRAPLASTLWLVSHHGAHAMMKGSVTLGKKCEIHTMKFAIAPLNP